MPKATTIRGLERGLQVLKALQAARAATLQDVHVDTGLPKPSLLRILSTLEQAGVIHRRMIDGRYRVSFNLTRVAHKPNRHDRLAEAAAPVLNRLCRKVAWPSDLAVPAGDHMEIRETSRPQSPFLLNREQVGHRVNWVLSGMGRAYLAFCPLEERERILAGVRETGYSENRLAFETRRFGRILSETRRRGYATRDPSFAGGYYGRHSSADGLAAIAVPVLGAGHVYGCINIVWLKKASTSERMADQHLADLQDAAAEIAAALATSPLARQDVSG
jgi:IclR family mhp operon transcriptional activator